MQPSGELRCNHVRVRPGRGEGEILAPTHGGASLLPKPIEQREKHDHEDGQALCELAQKVLYTLLLFPLPLIVLLLLLPHPHVGMMHPLNAIPGQSWIRSNAHPPCRRETKVCA